MLVFYRGWVWGMGWCTANQVWKTKRCRYYHPRIEVLQSEWRNHSSVQCIADQFGCCNITEWPASSLRFTRAPACWDALRSDRKGTSCNCLCVWPLSCVRLRLRDSEHRDRSKTLWTNLHQTANVAEPAVIQRKREKSSFKISVTNVSPVTKSGILISSRILGLQDGDHLGSSKLNIQDDILSFNTNNACSGPRFTASVDGFV